MARTVRRALVLGEESLLIQCGDLLIEHGVELAVVVSKNSIIRDWCTQKQINHVERYETLEGEYQPAAFDFVFSITNLRLLPDWLLALGRQAINFHDGPLPRYAGLNAPVWALLNDESEHGVTWHEMTAGVDTGRLLMQQTFPIVPGETALSINAKCYQAGLESFTRLIDAILNEQLQPLEQDASQRSYFARNQRPEAAGLIDWQAKADDIERLVRALDHGNYPNPLVTAKLFLGDELLLVKQAKIVERGPQRAPGQLTNMTPDALQVRCSDGVLELSGLTTLKGAAIPCLQQLAKGLNVQVGSELASLNNAARAQLTARVAEVCGKEEAWIEAYRAAEALSIPSAKPLTGGAPTSSWQQRDVALPASVLASATFQQQGRAYTLSLFALLLARLNAKESLTLAVEQSEPAPCDVFFENCLPLNLQLDLAQDFAIGVAHVAEQLARFRNMGTVASDLWARQPELAAHGAVDGYPVKLVLGAAPDEQPAAGTQVRLILDEEGKACVEYCSDVLSEAAVNQLLAQLNAIATSVSTQPEGALGEVSILSPQDLKSFSEWNNTAQDYNAAQCLHHLVEQQASLAPDAVALAFEEQSVSYQQLNARANQVARLLVEKGAKAGDLIGIMMDRSIDLVVSLVGIHKAGCAYVPLDPLYPADRLRYMVEDSGLTFLLTEVRHQDKLGPLSATVIAHDTLNAELGGYPNENLDIACSSDMLAYVIYTSGSTGKPKGVMVEHRSVVNFFIGMDACIGTQPGTWLAVTSISFDISVLELFWTLARGFKVVLYSEQSALGDTASSASPGSAGAAINMDFSLFYWNVADEDSHHQSNKYELLLEGAKFADTHGFKAVWNPERHFASFGGLFPNPAVTCAALATITKNVDLRAGSCVIPLHSPIRVAEEWAVVDNLSNGRVGMAVASGWAPPDFAIKPENFSDAKNIMFESLEKVQRLWRGEKVTFPGPNGDVEVRTLPRPIQKQLPYWVTTAGNVDTFKRAGEAGANVLTHLLGQTFEEVQEKVSAYRAARKAAGHEGKGTITLMLHTLVGESMDQVEEIVRQPMKDYLKSAMFLVKGAAWTFPTFKKMSEETGKTLDEFFETISDEDMDDLLEFAFQRYFRTSGLFGTPETARDIVAKCEEIGVDEIACLIDFGIDTQVVLQHLPYLDQLKQNCVGSVLGSSSQSATVASASQGQADYSVPALIEKHGVTHFQCTPSMATMLVSDPASKARLKPIQHMMVGGEAMPPALAEGIKEAISGRLTNMYGPTETTIWSSVCDIEPGEAISIGRPIANTQIYIVDQNLQPLPAGVAGELVIAGDGVVRGYHAREELTKERFVDGWQLHTDAAPTRIYRTGDLARFAEDGSLMCLGRIDHQVKIRGYRIELGEIESLLQAHDSVRECAVILREDTAGDKRLVAYVRPAFGQHLNADALKQHLAAQLPEFMVPAFYVELATMPLTPNGKLDRKALPAPIQERHKQSGQFSLPENEWENLVADIWKRALGVNEVGRQDNFFDIGGHSLLVIQVLKELREHEKVTKAVQMTDLFRHTTIEALARFIASEGDGQPGPSGAKAASSRVAARKAAMSRRRRR